MIGLGLREGSPAAAAIIGATAIGALATLGDFIWAEFGLRHHVSLGLAHGGLLFMAIGAYVGFMQTQLLRGALAGTCVGLLAAGSFYVLAPMFGYAVMFAVWAFIWFAIAVLDGRIVRTSPRPWTQVLTRGMLAMIASGAAFYLISDIWRPFDPAGWDYAVHLLSWTFAFLPAFLALFLPFGR